VTDFAVFITSAVVSGAGLGLAVGYLCVCALGRDRRHRALYDASGWAAHRRRRYLATALVVTISAAFFVGVNFLDETSSPLFFLGFWLGVSVLVVWLCLLALADLRQTRKEHRRHLAEVARSFAESTKSPNRGVE
jgi:undecaprenyl pyrophosphate phosphatase UppP